MSKQVAAFKFQAYGVDHSQYFPGVSTVYTSWDEVFVGVGDTAREAAEDALSSYCTGAEDWTPELATMVSAEIETLDNEASAHDDCIDPMCSGHDECELNHYVALYVRYQAEDEPVPDPAVCPDCGEARTLRADCPAYDVPTPHDEVIAYA